MAPLRSEAERSFGEKTRQMSSLRFLPVLKKDRASSPSGQRENVLLDTPVFLEMFGFLRVGSVWGR